MSTRKGVAGEGELLVSSTMLVLSPRSQAQARRYCPPVRCSTTNCTVEGSLRRHAARRLCRMIAFANFADGELDHLLREIPSRGNRASGARPDCSTPSEAAQ